MDRSARSRFINLIWTAGLRTSYHDQIRPLSETASMCVRPDENCRIVVVPAGWASRKQSTIRLLQSILLRRPECT